MGLDEQRNYGLFKKVYELGVLCSVYIAVIILGMCMCFSHIEHPLMSSIVDVVDLPLPSLPHRTRGPVFHHVPNYDAGTAAVSPFVTSDHHHRLSHHAVLFPAPIVRRRLLLLGPSPSRPSPPFRITPLNDKNLHLICLCLATPVFYFIFDVEECVTIILSVVMITD